MQEFMKMDYLGEFEQIVMLTILRLRENAYGMKVRTEIKDVAGRDASLGAVYTTLERLEDKGFISSWVGEVTEPRAGRAKKYFKITAAGAAALNASLRATESLKAGLEPDLGLSYGS
jgi:PadR family transcriptional regulator, regulatory protein PadR